VTPSDQRLAKYSRLVLDLSWLVTLFCAFVIGLVIFSYLYYSFQSYRGPSPIYFCVTLLLYLFSKKLAFFSLIFLLPISPALHEQLSFIRQPAVPFFIATPGIDICAAFIVGTVLSNIAKYQKLLMKAEVVPWPVAATSIIIIVSTIVAITRNFMQTGQEFNFENLIAKILLFKLIVRGDIYVPLVDIFTFSVCALLIGILINYFKKNKDSEEIFIKALSCALFTSAIWGILQAITRFGLASTTYDHRADSLFYGAQGFQPDLHAFGALMMIGAVGLFGYFFYATTNRTKLCLGVVIVLSWTALLMSKSRASIAFAFVAVIILIILKVIKRKGSDPFYNYLFIIFFVMVIITALPLLVTSQFVRDIYSSDYLNFDLWNNTLSLRPDFHRAAVRMFSDFPWFGAGQGNFLSMSADPILNYSSELVAWKGDNAHNYFLQTLAELGIVGWLGFIVIFTWPLVFVRKVSLVPAYMIIMSIFLGNIYSHSLIVRENLFLLTIVIALIYSKMKLGTKVIRRNALDACL
jgi:O-antigen ligase